LSEYFTEAMNFLKHICIASFAGMMKSQEDMKAKKNLSKKYYQH